MPKLTDEQKAANRFKRLMDTAACCRENKYLNKYVKPDFCALVRAEAAIFVGMVPSVVKGEIVEVYSPFGMCVCVTCGVVRPWKNKGYNGCSNMDAGHYLTGDRVVLEPTNCHPQCSGNCNIHGSGESSNYRLYISHVYGEYEVDRLHRLKNAKDYQKPSHEELVTKRIEFMDRLAVAKAIIEANQ